MPHPRELPVPRQIANEQKAFEIARLWIVAGGGQHVSLNTTIVGDTKGWGILLVNLARHVSNAYHQTRGIDPSQTLAGIKAAFDAEWANPTQQPTGEVAQKQEPTNP